MTGADRDLGTDGWFRLARGALWLCGACYLLFGLVIAWIVYQRPTYVEPDTSKLITAGAVFGVCVGCAVGNFVVAWALARRKSWAWVAGVVIGGLYAPSGCFVFGLVILYALLRGGVKEAYDAEAREKRGAPKVF